MKWKRWIIVDDPSDPNPLPDAIDREESGPQEPTLDQDTMFEALAHERRRYLLYTLFEDEALPLRDLARRMAAWEGGVPQSEVVEMEVERIYASLYHAHVPKLVDLDMIEFDCETITKGKNAEQVLQVLEITGASDAISLENHARNDEYD